MTDVVSKPVLVVAAILAVVSGGFLYWQFYLVPKPVIPPVPHPVSIFTSDSAYASLGENIYKRSQDAVVNKVPDAPAPNVNPIKGAYKNPFE